MITSHKKRIILTYTSSAVLVNIICLSAGYVGTNSAAATIGQMKSKFPSIQYNLMVGIGGGVPYAEADIRLGDVVISQSHYNGIALLESP